MVSLNHDDILRLLDNEYGNLEDFSFRFSFANADNLPEEPTESNVTVQTIIRPMPYLENIHIPPRDKPTMAGVHYSKRSGLGFTLQFPNGLFH